MGTDPLSAAPTRALGLLAAAATGVQVGAATVASRPLLAVVDPATLALLRYAVGLAVLAPFVLRARSAPIAPSDRLPILLLGVGQFGALIWLFNVGLQTVTAGLAALIFSVFPLLTLLLATAIGRERLTAAAMGGAALCLAGLVASIGLSGRAGWGAAALLAAAAVGAVCSIGYRPYLSRYPTLAIGWRAMAAACAALLPLALMEGAVSDVPRLDAAGWALVLFVGTASGAGYLVWLTALRLAPASQATLLLGLSPLAALALDWALLGTRPGLGAAFGLPLILGGLALALRPARR